MKFKTIRANMVFYYSIVVLIIIISLTVSLYIYGKNVIENRSIESLTNISSLVSSNIDIKLKEMNDVSTRILFSEPLIQIFYSDMYDDTSESYTEQLQFNDYFYSVLGPNPTFYRINMFKLNGDFLSIGYSAFFKKFMVDDIQSIAWLKDAIELKGSKLFISTHYDNLNISKKPVISLCRSFSSLWGKDNDAVIEIQIRYNTLASIVQDKYSNNNIKSDEGSIIVLNNDGTIVYPFNVDSINNHEINKYWDKINQDSALQNTFTIDDNILVYSKSTFSEFTTIIVEPKDYIDKPLNNFTLIIFVSSIVLIYLTLFVTNIISSKITKPLQDVNKFVSNINLDNLSEKPIKNVKADFGEIEEVVNIIVEMQGRLNDSLDNVVQAKTHEIHSRLIALQAQMSPHFLYNIITTISALSEGNNDYVVKICNDLSDILRYISSDVKTVVTLETELVHVNAYVELMKVRYPQELFCEFDIPEELKMILLPKLSIQPLIENSIKFLRKVSPPWHINITGYIKNEHVIILVTDDGPGFLEETIINLNEQFERVNQKQYDNGLELNGMGILNIYTRLKLLYKEDAMLLIRNNENKGASIELHIPIKMNKDDDNVRKKI